VHLENHAPAHEEFAPVPGAAGGEISLVRGKVFEKVSRGEVIAMDIRTASAIFIAGDAQ
jgi:hypothetical protein